MDVLLDIANGVVLVLFLVRAHSLDFARLRQPNSRRVVVRAWPRHQRATAVLPQMLTPCSLDQAVDRVVGVIVARLDALVKKENDVLNVCVVLDMRDISDRIVYIREVLDDLLAGGISRARGRQPG